MEYWADCQRVRQSPARLRQEMKEPLGSLRSNIIIEVCGEKDTVWSARGGLVMTGATVASCCRPVVVAGVSRAWEHGYGLGVKHGYMRHGLMARGFFCTFYLRQTSSQLSPLLRWKFLVRSSGRSRQPVVALAAAEPSTACVLLL